MLIKFEHKQLDWDQIGLHNNLKLEWIIKFQYKQWNWVNICKNKNLKKEWIDNYP